MPVLIQCSCGRSLKLSDDLKGKRIRCPECRNVLDVPLGNVARSSQPKPARRERAEVPRASRKRRTSPSNSRRKFQPPQRQGLPKWIILVGGSSLAIVAAFFLVPWGSLFTTKVASETSVSADSGLESSISDGSSTQPGKSSPLADSPDAGTQMLRFDTNVQVSEYCSVQMPELPESDQKSMPTSYGPVTGKTFTCDMGSILFTAAHTNYSDSFLDQAVASLGGDRTKILQRAAAAARGSRPGSQVLSESVSQIANGHQLDMTFTFQAQGAAYGGTSVTRAFLHGNQMHLVGFEVSEQESLENPDVIDRLKNQFFGALKLNVPMETSTSMTQSDAAATDSLFAGAIDAAKKQQTQDPMLSTGGRLAAGTPMQETSGDTAGSRISIPFPTSAIPETGASAFKEQVRVSENFTVRFPALVRSMSSDVPGSTAKFGLHESQTPEAKFVVSCMDFGSVLGNAKPDKRVVADFLEAHEPSDELFTITEQSFANSEGISRYDRTFTVTNTNDVVAISRVYVSDTMVYGAGIRLTNDTVASDAGLLERLVSGFFGSISISKTSGATSSAPFRPVDVASTEAPVTSKASSFTSAASNETSKPSSFLPSNQNGNSDSPDSQSSVVWGSTEKFFALPNKHNSTVSYSGSPVRALCIDETIWDVSSGREVGKISLPDPSRCFIVANADCSRAAAFIRTTSWELTEIRIFETNGGDGSPISIPIQGAPWVEEAFFTGEDRLIARLRVSPNQVFRVWNAENGTELKPLEIDFTGTGATAMSHDGKYMAVGDWEGVQVIDMSSSKVVATMSNPAAGDGKRFPHTEAIAFSPDMTELAGLMSGDRLVVWSNRGKVLIDHQITPSEGLAEDAIQWLPSGKGWFVRNELLVLREDLIDAWMIKYPSFLKMVPGHVLDENHILLASGGFLKASLSSHEIPWDDIDAAIQAINPEKNALLFPGQTVSLDIQVETVRFSNPLEVTSAITKALTARLEKAQLLVGANQPVVIEVKYSETVGKELTVRQSSVFSGNSSRTQLPDTNIKCELKLKDSEAGKTIWSSEVTANAGLIINAETVDEAALRADAFRMLLSKIQHVRIPTRVASDSNQQLPVVTEIGE